MTIDSRQLRYFVEVATLGSINKAAMRLYIAQPALSRRMRQLEYELGVDLFNRSASGVELTPAGRRLLGRAAALGEEFRRLREAAHEDAPPPEHELHIGMVPGPSLMLLNPLVAAFHKEEPESLLRVVEGPSEMLRAHLVERKLEVSLATDPVPDPLLRFRPLWAEALYFLCPLAVAGVRDRMLQLPFVLPTKDASIVSICRDALDRLDLPFRFDLEISAASSVKHLIAAGNACSILPYSALAEDEAPAYSATRVPGMKITRAIAWRSGTDLTRSAATVVRLIEELLPGLRAADRLGGLLPA